MGKGGSGLAATGLAGQEDAGEYWCAVADARGGRGAGSAMQAKLHQWAVSDPGRRFDDLFNLVYDPALLVVAWRRDPGRGDP